MKTLLTSIDYVRILAALGESKKPLSSYELAARMKEKRWLIPTEEKDLMRKLRKLNPMPDEQEKSTFLFDWNKLQSSPNDSYYLIQTLNKIFKLLNLGIKAGRRINRGRYHLNEEIQIDKKFDEGVILIRIGSYSVILISVGKDSERIIDSGFILYLIINEDNTIAQKKVNELIVRNKGRTKLINTKKRIPDRIWFLNIILNDKARKKLNPLLARYWDCVRNWHQGSYMKLPVEISYEINNHPDCMKIINNSTHWKYNLNFRSFVLFLAGESKIESSDVRSEQRIRDVISNPTTFTIAPFLDYWDKFEQIGFDVLNTLKNIGKDFESHIYLKDFTEEDLVYMITERYSDLLEQYLTSVRMYSFPANITKFRKYHDLNIENIRKRYFSKILIKQKQHLDQKVSGIEEKLSLLA